MVRLRGLGECLFEIGATTLTPDSSTLFALLLYLARHAGDHVPRDRLLALFWPMADEESASHRLRQNVYRLRRLGAVVHTRADGVQLDAAHTEADQAQIYITPELLESGIDEQRLGVFLPGYAPRVSARFDAWVDAERTVVGLELRDALLTRLMESRTRGRFAEVERLSRRCLMLDPLNEEATLALAEATALRGSKVEAVRMVDEYLTEIGPAAGELRIQPKILRARVSELDPPEPTLAVHDGAIVGRDAELSIIQQVLRGSSSAVIVVHGTAGVGKSRLLTEISRRSRLAGIPTAVARCYSTLPAPAMGVVLQLLPQLLTFSGALGCAPSSLALARSFGEIGTSDDQAPAVPDPRIHDYARFRIALLDIVDAVLTEGPLTVVIDDADRIDPTSAGLIEDLSQNPDSLRLFLAARTPEFDDVADRFRSIPVPIIPMALGSLDERSANKLFTDVTTALNVSVGERVHASCLRFANGHALSLRQLAVHLKSDSALATLPASLAELLRTRLASLSQTASLLLRASAVLDEHATFESIDAILALPRHSLLAAVEELEAVDLIRSDGKRIACRHDLIRDSVLAGMPEATVRLLHTSAAQFLADSMDNASHISMLWALAKHWQKAGSKSEAFTTWKQVAHHLISVGVPADAAEALKHAAECLPTDSDRPALEQSLMHAYSLAAAWPQYLSLASKLNSYSRAANRPPEVSAPDILNARWRANENPFSVLEDAIMAANDTSESPNDRMRSLVIGLIISDNQCRKQAADSLHHALTTIDQNEVAPHILAEAQMIYNASFGELPIARESAMSLIAATRKKADVVATCRALRRASIPLIRCGDFSTAEDALSEALEISHDVGAPRDAVPTLHGLLGLHLTTQSLSKAAEAVEQLSVWIARYRSSWGLGALAAGRLRLALAVNDQVVIPDLYRELRTADWMTVGSRVHFGMIAWLLEAELALGRYENISTRVRHLRKFYTRAKSCGDFDVAATALLRGMYRIGEGPGAKTLGLSYVDRHRRELYPSSQDLLDAIEGKERG